MSLADAGALFALVDKREDAHVRCQQTLRRLPKPIFTTWPCFTEAMYLAYRAGGFPMQLALWRYVDNRVVIFHDLSEADIERTKALMEKYRDTPMDMADASLVAAAEARDIKQVFTLDSDFYVYQRYDKEPFEVAP